MQIEEFVEGAGAIRATLRFIVKPALTVWKKLRPPKEIVDCGYKMNYRKIVAVYATHASGKLSHEIEMKATRDYVTHYDGRHPLRDKSHLTIKPPHKLAMGDRRWGFQLFKVELEDALLKTQTAVIMQELEWEHQDQFKHPEVTFVPLCETDLVTFAISFPDGTQISDPVVQTAAHGSMHVFIEKEHLTMNNNLLTWQKANPEIGVAYRITWKWL